MMTLIVAAAVAAAQPAIVPANPTLEPRPTMNMGGSQEQHGQMAEMKDCCCKDMMSKMHGGHSAAHKGRSGE